MPFKLKIDDFMVSGRIDDLVLLKHDGKMILVEVKSTKDIKFVKEPNKSYITQLQLYMYATGIKNGVILYIDKSGLKTKTFDVKYDDKVIESIFDRFKILHHHISTDDIPFAEAKKVKDMSWMCRYCDYKDRCDREK